MRTLTLTLLFRAAVLAWLSALQSSLQAGGLIEREPFESLEGITAIAGQRELSSAVVREGKTSLKFSATVNPQDALLIKQFPQPVDLSAFNALRFWIYPDVPEDTFSLEVRLAVWNDEKGGADWHTVGNISNATAPNRTWSRLCFYLGEVPRKKVLRHFDLIAWHFGYRQNQPVTFYLDDLAFESVPLEQQGLLLNGSLERELLPWHVGEVWRGGEAVLDPNRRREGQSSLRVSSPAGQPSRTVEQTVEVNGGHWYRLSLWLRTQQVGGWEGAGANLEWQSAGPQQPVLKTYGSSWGQWGARLLGTNDFTWISRLVKAPAQAKRCKLTLQVRAGGTAWFDAIRLEEADAEAEALGDVWGMPPRRTLLWKPQVTLPAVLSFSPVKGSLRLALEPVEGHDFTLSLGGDRAGEVPLIRFRAGKVYACHLPSPPYEGGDRGGLPYEGGDQGGVWEPLGGAFTPNWSLVIYLNLERNTFAVNTGGINLPWYGPFRIEGPLREVWAVYLRRTGRPKAPSLLKRLLVEGPLWSLEEVERRQAAVRRLPLRMVERVGWMAEAEQLPEDLREESPPRPSPWTPQAAILHTGVRFDLLEKNLERLKAMGFTTLCLRPPQPSGRIGIGSDCCVQDYHSINPEKGSAPHLKRLIAQAHHLGLKVIFWLVPNHTACSNPLFARRPELFYFDASSFRSAWFDVVDLDYTNPDTWRTMAQIAVQWVRQFDLDGFGVDVPDLIPRNFFAYLRRELAAAKRGDLFMVMETSFTGVEQWGGDVRYGFLSAYQMQEIFEGVTPPPKPPQRVIASLIERLYPHESWEAFGPFGGNWGLIGCLNRYGPELTKCAAVVMATLPFVPEVCVGSEILEPPSEDDPYGFVARVLNLRQKHPSFHSTQVEMVPHNQEEQACIYLKRSDSEWALVLINFSAEPVTLTLTLPAEAATAFHGWPPTDLLTGQPVSWRWLSEQQAECELPARTPVIAVVSRAAEVRRPNIGFTEDHVLLVDGKPFFPIGLYHPWHTQLEPDALAEIAGQGFNNRHLARLAPIVLAPTSPAKVQLDPPDAPVVTLVKAHAGDTFVFAVNTSGETLPIKMALPGFSKEAQVAELLSDKHPQVSDNGIVDTFPPLAVRVYRMVSVVSAGLAKGAGENLVPNGSFQALDPDGKPARWGGDRDHIAAGPRGELRYAIPPEGGWHSAVQSASFPLRAGRRYRLAVHLSAQQAGGLFVRLTWLDAKGQPLPHSGLAAPLEWENPSWDWASGVGEGAFLRQSGAGSWERRTWEWAGESPPGTTAARVEITVQQAGGGFSLHQVRVIEEREGLRRAKRPAIVLPEEGQPGFIRVSLSNGVRIAIAGRLPQIFGIGPVSVGSIPLRNGWTLLRPLIRTTPPTHYRQCLYRGAEVRGQEVVLSTALVGPDGEDTLDWVLAPRNVRIGGTVARGLAYGYRFHSPRNKAIEILDLGSWELGGAASGNTLLEVPGFPTAYLAALDSAYQNPYHASYPMEEPPKFYWGSELLAMRFSTRQCFDYQIGPLGSLIGYYERPTAITSGIGKPKGSENFLAFDRILLPASSSVSTPMKCLLHSPRNDPDHWAEVYDHTLHLSQSLYGLREEDLLPWSCTPGHPRNALPFISHLASLNFKRHYTAGPWEPAPGGGIGTLSVEGGSAGEAEVRQVADALHQAGLQFLVWFPCGHLGKTSPLLQDNPSWIVHNPDGSIFDWGYQDLANVSMLTSYRDYVLNSVRPLREKVGIDGFWMDSHCLFGGWAIDYTSPRRSPQLDEMVSAQAEIQRMGYVTLVESVSPFGLTAVTADPQQWEGQEEYAYKTCLYFMDAAPPDQYYRFLANKSCPIALYNFRENNPRIDAYGQANADYNRVYPTMKHRHLLPEHRGVLWSSGSSQVLFAFTDFSLPLPRPLPVLDVTRDQPLGDLRVLHATTQHTYLLGRSGTSGTSKKEAAIRRKER